MDKKKYSEPVTNMRTIYTVFVILFQICLVGSLHLCSNKDGTLTCCQGYKFDHAQTRCIPCENGFTGTNCVTKCQYPTYGKGCQSVCDCNATVCDSVNGCINASESKIPYQYYPLSSI